MDFAFGKMTKIVNHRLVEVCGKKIKNMYPNGLSEIL
jgi:hypothetical protein